MRPKICLLLTAQDGVGPEQLERAMADEAALLDASSPHPLAHIRALRIEDDELARVAAGAFDAGRPFDAVMGVVLEPDGQVADLIPLFEGFANRFQSLIRPERCGVLAGSEHVVLPGTGSFLVLIANRRLPAFSHQAFIDYWVDYHGPFAREHTPPDAGLRYRQFHADPQPSHALAQSAGLGVADFDGAAECYYATAEQIRNLMGQAQVVDQATEDERKFVDHARCVTSLLRVMTADP